MHLSTSPRRYELAPWSRSQTGVRVEFVRLLLRLVCRQGSHQREVLFVIIYDLPSPGICAAPGRQGIRDDFERAA